MQWQYDPVAHTWCKRGVRDREANVQSGFIYYDAPTRPKSTTERVIEQVERGVVSIEAVVAPRVIVDDGQPARLIDAGPGDVLDMSVYDELMSASED